LQYISLVDAFRKMDDIILPHGRWIVVDYFRSHDSDKNRGSHLLDEFKQQLNEHHWNIVVERDITRNVLPTIAFANLYVDRFLLPLKHYAYEKLRYKKGWLFYLTDRIRASIDAKINKERNTVDPTKFLQEKKYLFFVLEK